MTGLKNRPNSSEYFRQKEELCFQKVNGLYRSRYFTAHFVFF